MKTRIYPIGLSILISMFLLTGTAHAGQTENCPQSGLENAVEPVLAIEGWMLDENYWLFSGNTGVAGEYGEPFSLEAWMTDIQSWETFNYASADKEEPLQIESWMTNSLKWNENDPLMAEVIEKDLSIESWMTDAEHWY